MDGQRFDALTKTVATAVTRRRVLRLAGGTMTGALLATVGLSRRAGAQQDTPQCRQTPIGCQGRCAQGRVCGSVTNPGNQVICRCFSLTR